MRTRRRFRPTRRRFQKGRGDWVVAADFPCFAQMSLADSCQADPFTPAAVFSASLIDTQDLVDKEDALTVVRTVGEVNYLISGEMRALTSFKEGLTSIFVAEGIYVAGADAETPTPAVIELDPRNPGDFQLDTWMWHRRTHYELPYAMDAGGFTVQFRTNNDYQEPLGPHLDLRVKRRLKRGQELVYVTAAYFQQAGFSTTTVNLDDWTAISCAVQMHLRCYVKF